MRPAYSARVSLPPLRGSRRSRAARRRLMRWGGRPPGPPGCATLPVLEFGSVGERVGDVVLTIVNQDEPRINTKTDGPALLDLLCCDGVMGGSPPGSAGVPPAQHWQSLAHLLDPDRPAKTPGLCLGRAPAVPAGRVEGCAIAGKLSDNPRERVRAGRPRSRVGRFRHDCLSRESRRNRTRWMVALNPDLTIPSWPFVDHSFSLFLLSQI